MTEHGQSDIENQTFGNPIDLRGRSGYLTEPIYPLRELEFERLTQPNTFLYALSTTLFMLGLGQLVQNIANSMKDKSFKLGFHLVSSNENIPWVELIIFGLLLFFIARHVSSPRSSLNKKIRKFYKDESDKHRGSL